MAENVMTFLDCFWLLMSAAPLVYGAWAAQCRGPGTWRVLVMSGKARVLAVVGVLLFYAAVMGTLVFPADGTWFYVQRALVVRPATVGVSYLALWLFIDEVANRHYRPRR